MDHHIIDELNEQGREHVAALLKLKIEWPDMPPSVVERINLWVQMYGVDEEKSVEACIKLSILFGIDNKENLNG